MRLTRFVVLTMMVSATVFAEDVKIVGTISQTVKLPAEQTAAINKEQKKAATTKVIKLLDVRLSNKAKKSLVSKAQKLLTDGTSTNSKRETKFPRKIELGMEGVPVLDQGPHGTCVTFAITAALDAALKKKDYISQLCQLELGNYLANTSYGNSGWDGAWARMVLAEIDQFGFVNKEQQLAGACGGITEYPAEDNEPPSASLTIEEHHQLSEHLNEDAVRWSTVLDVYQAFEDRIDTEKTVSEVKQILRAGDRLPFAILLLDFDQGVVGAVGRHKMNSDTWVLTPEIARDIYINPVFAGHEMIITGYDDNAIAIDDKGREHRGLFTLRNSWGDGAGDQGDFYMSYDYFKLLVIEVTRIRTDDNEPERPR